MANTPARISFPGKNDKMSESDRFGIATGLLKPKGRSVKYFTLIIVCFFLWLGNSTCFGDDNEKISRILYINSYHPGYSWSDSIEKGLRDSLNSSGKEYNLSVEYLDTRRFTAPAWQETLKNIILSKYEDFPQDLIIVSDNAAFDFAIANRSHFFPQAPLVFCGYNNFHPDLLNGQDNITGVNEEMNIDALVSMALSIQPETGTLAFIEQTADPTSKTIADHAEEIIIPKYRDQYRIVLFKDKTLAQIKEGFSRLPENSALFLLGATADMPTGQATMPDESAKLILPHSPVPAYTLWDFHLGLGVLGGHIITGYQQGKTAGEMAVQILNGRNASDIPVMMKSPVSDIFDYQVMQHFGIKISDLPAGSTLINKPETLYSKHKMLVWGAIGLFSLLTLFIFILLLNIFRRVRAEHEILRYRDHLEKLVEERTAELTATNSSLKSSEERFRTLANASFEGISVIEEERLIDFNDTYARMFGYTREEMLGRKPTDFIAPEKRQDVLEKVRAGYDAPYETLGLKKDGSIFPLEIHAALHIFIDKQIRISALRDLTERKAAEKEINLLRGILPICARCKKIRDDDGYWNQLETYIQNHSEAQFSHSLCHDCAKEIYPALDLSKMNQKKND